MYVVLISLLTKTKKQRQKYIKKITKNVKPSLPMRHDHERCDGTGVEQSTKVKKGLGFNPFIVLLFDAMMSVV